MPRSSHCLATLIANGHGRSYSTIAEQNGTQHFEVVAKACLANDAPDPQSEGVRGAFLYDLISCFAEKAYIHDEVMHALSIADDYWSRVQLFDLARRFAQDGSARARHAIYENCRYHATSNSFPGACSLVDLEGIEGFISAARLIGTFLISAHGVAYKDDVYSYASGLLGENNVQNALSKSVANDSALTIYRNVVQKQLRRHRESGFSTMTYRELRDDLALRSDQAFRRDLRLWGRRSSFVDMMDAASDFQDAFDDELILNLLSVFHGIEPPTIILDRLCDLARSDNGNISSAALEVLSNAKGALSLELAFELFDGGQISRRVLSIFGQHWNTAFLPLILDRLPSRAACNERHMWSEGIADILERVDDGEILDLARWSYDMSPCGLCRHVAVKAILKHERDPTAIARECLHDSYDGTRVLARHWVETHE